MFKKKSKKKFLLKLVVALTICLMNNNAHASIYNATLNGNFPVETESKSVALKSINEVISAEKISAVYQFENTGDRKENVIMAYKMPKLRSDYMHSNVYKDLNVTVNGEKVAVNSTRKAYIDGKDITDVLKRNNLEIPVDACLRGEDKKFSDTAKNLTQKQKKELNLAGIDIDNILKGDCWLPWDLEINYSWAVTIDTKASSQVEISYTPNLTSYAIPLLSDKIKQDYCIDEKSYKTLSEKIGFGKTYPYFLEENMIPSRSWKGSIEKVKLRVESKKVGSFVFSCYGGMDRKNEFEIDSEQFNVEPQEDLKVLFFLKN